jgi:hypothetical protein
VRDTLEVTRIVTEWLNYSPRRNVHLLGGIIILKLAGMFTTKEQGSHGDHLMRATQFHHVQLSSMADVKANMLLTMSSVVLTLSLPQVLKNDHLWPLNILIGFCLLTICFATYAVMPKLPPANLPPPDVHSPHFNILFFGDFSRLTQQQFEVAMSEVLSSHDNTHAAQVREIYLLGIFLAKKKYRYLRYGYLTFIAGLFFTLISFVISSMF